MTSGTGTGTGTRIASVSGLRGVVGNGLDPLVAVEFVAAYLGGCGPGAIVVGHDGRVSAPTFHAAVIAAVTACGREVLDAGATATPTLGILVSHGGAAGGIQISASHNPPEYNGFKFFQPEGMVLSPEQGRAVLEALGRREFPWVGVNRLGRVTPIGDPDGEHLRRVLAVVDGDAIRRCGFKVVLDASHGAGGRLGERLLRELGCDVLVLGGRPDGRYRHAPEPTEENLRETAAIIRAVGADLGFAQDPDADRLAIIDETGGYIGEELTLALAATRRLEQERGPIVLNLSTSRVTEELALRANCPVYRTPVGEIHVVQALRAHNALLGGEGNGGVIDPRIGFVRDSFVAMALVLDLLATAKLKSGSGSAQTLSSQVRLLPQFAMVKHKFPQPPAPTTPDATSDVAARWSGVWDAIVAAEPLARADRRDGLRLDWSDRWAHLRTSNTEPIVRVIAEAPTAAEALALASRLGERLGTNT